MEKLTMRYISSFVIFMFLIAPVCTNADIRGQNLRNEGNGKINEHSPHNSGSVMINGDVEQDCGGNFHIQGDISNSNGTINSNSPHNDGVVVINGNIKQNCDSGSGFHAEENISNKRRTMNRDNLYNTNAFDETIRQFVQETIRNQLEMTRNTLEQSLPQPQEQRRKKYSNE
jgi:formylmethanofuran dehydrogenase subunit C